MLDSIPLGIQICGGIWLIVMIISSIFIYYELKHAMPYPDEESCIPETEEQALQAYLALYE